MVRININGGFVNIDEAVLNNNNNNEINIQDAVLNIVGGGKKGGGGKGGGVVGRGLGLVVRTSTATLGLVVRTNTRSSQTAGTVPSWHSPGSRCSWSSGWTTWSNMCG